MSTLRNLLKITIPAYIISQQLDEPDDAITPITNMRNYMCLDLFLCVLSKGVSFDTYIHHVGGIFVNTLLCRNHDFEWPTKHKWVLLEGLTFLTGLEKEARVNTTVPSILFILGFRIPYLLSLHRYIHAIGKHTEILYALLTMQIMIDIDWLKLYLKRIFKYKKKIIL